MAVKDWPRPGRLAFGWTMFVAITAISFGPPIWVSYSLASLANTQDLSISWSRLLGGYATAITAPLAIIFSAAGAHQMRTRIPYSFAAYGAAGGAIGIFIGLVLSIVTGGYSLLSAPAFSYLTFVIFWLIRRPDRDQPSPASNGTSA